MEINPDAAIAGLQELERELARLHARQAELLVAAASAEPWVDEFLLLDPRPDHDEERHILIADVVREEIAAALRWSPSVAQSRIDAARLLCGPLADTRAALLDGTISPRHATEIVEAAGRLPGRHLRTEDEKWAFTYACQRLEERVLPTARRGTVSQTRSAARKAVILIDPAGQARRRDEARCTRDVYVMDELDGVSTLVARLATEQAHAVLSAVAAHAAALVDVDPVLTAGEVRADALAALVLGAAVGDDEPRIRATVDVVVPLDVLLGGEQGLAELVRSGAVASDVVGDLLADRDVQVMMRRLVTDPITGQLLDLGRSTYAVPQRLRDFIVARDRTCRFPGCARRADLCQMDHAVGWDDGGETTPANLGALCVRHHQLKTLAGWRIVWSAADGSCEWESPAGRRYRRDPRTSTS